MHDRVGFLASAWVRQAYRLHRSKPQRLRPATSHLLHRKATFKICHLVEVVSLVLVRSDEGLDERVVAIPIERRIEIILTTPLAVSRQAVQDGFVEGIGRDNWGDGVEERQMRRAEAVLNGRGQTR